LGQALSFPVGRRWPLQSGWLLADAVEKSTTVCLFARKNPRKK
jgi:hypothetical protein